MQQSVQITFRGLKHSAAVEANIREKAAKLETFYPRIVGCEVAVEAEHRYHHQGNLYHVRIYLDVPGKDIVISQEHHDEHAREDVYVVIRDAFDAARRKLEDHARRQRGKIKTHQTPAHGRVVGLYSEERRGRIETPNGQFLEFDSGDVSGGRYDNLCEGCQVRFEEAEDEEGVRATAIHIIGKHHPVG